MIVVTAPTGSIGAQLVPHLLAAGERPRLITRDPAKLAPALRETVEVVQGSLDDPAVLTQALAGAQSLFLLVPFPFHAEDITAYYLRFLRPAADAVTAQGVQHVVAVSGLYAHSQGRTAGMASVASVMDHLLGGTGAAYRALWCASFMENLLQQVPSLARHGVFFGPALPDQKRPLVATRDIAATAAHLLLDASWTGQGGVAVLGPEDLSHSEMADIMTAVLGTPIRFQQMSADAATAQLLQAGASEAVAHLLREMYAAAADDPHGSVPRTPENTTPTSFRQWCADVLKPAIQH
jgi:uncharacterized protein YbjT (DUF2867 family)